MKKYLYLSIAVMALAGVVFLGTAATALAAKGIIKTQGSGTGSGSGITVTELGVENPGTLPTSPFYFLKEWGRGLERFFTFNSVKKAELELRITNEKAAEALKVQETKPNDAGALAIALENYTGAGERLQARLAKLKETSENPNVEKLLEKLDEQTLKHSILLNQLAEKWNTDPYVEDATRNQIQGDPDFDLIANAVKDAQWKIQDIVLAATQKDKNIEQKAAEEIKRAEDTVGKLKDEYGIELAGIAIDEPGAQVSKIIKGTKDVDNQAAGEERQTPKTDFGDRMKAGLDTVGGILANAQAHLALAKTAFAESKFGEAFGQARAAEVLAKNGSRVLAGVLRPDVGGLEDGESIKKPAQREEPKPQTQTYQQQQTQQQEQKPISETTEQKIQQPEVKDETADWKTYRNEKYGFEVKYPQDKLYIAFENKDDKILILSRFVVYIADFIIQEIFISGEDNCLWPKKCFAGWQDQDIYTHMKNIENNRKYELSCFDTLNIIQDGLCDKIFSTFKFIK